MEKSKIGGFKWRNYELVWHTCYPNSEKPLYRKYSLNNAGVSKKRERATVCDKLGIKNVSRKEIVIEFYNLIKTGRRVPLVKSNQQ